MIQNNLSLKYAIKEPLLFSHYESLVRTLLSLSSLPLLVETLEELLCKGIQNQVVVDLHALIYCLSVLHSLLATDPKATSMRVFQSTRWLSDLEFLFSLKTLEMMMAVGGGGGGEGQVLLVAELVPILILLSEHCPIEIKIRFVEILYVDPI